MSVDEEAGCGEVTVNQTVKSFSKGDEEMKEEGSLAAMGVRGEKGERLARFWGE